MIAKLGTLTGATGRRSSGTLATQVLHTFTGSVPAGSTVVVMGLHVSSFAPPPYVTRVFDSKGNPYTIRTQPGSLPGIVVADSCQIPTALANGDTISVEFSGSDGMYVYGGGWFSQCSFNWIALSTWAGTAAEGGLINTSTANELVLGHFGVFNPTVQSVATMTAGAGYTAGGAVSSSSTSGPDWDAYGISGNWEYKLGSGPGLEKAIATMSTTAPTQHGVTASYYEIISNQMMGVV